MLFGPGVKNITVANKTKAIRSECDMGASCDLRDDLRPLRQQHDGDAANDRDHSDQPQRSKGFAEHHARRGRADERHQQRERHHLRRGIIPQQPAPQPVGDAGGDPAEADHAHQAGQRHVRQRVPGRLRAIADQRQREQRHRGDQTQPREQVEHRHALRAPEQQIADREAERRDHQYCEGSNAEIIADGAADHQQANGRDTDADGLPRARPLVEQERGKTDRKQRLALHDHAGKTDGNAMGDGKGLGEKLAEKQREADRSEHAP